MKRYTRDFMKSGAEAINDFHNMLLLRTDLHRNFDKATFVFIPKAGDIVIHVLQPMKELLYLYHNTRLTETNAPRQHLLTRFAWAIFPSVEGFLRYEGREKQLLLANSSTPTPTAAADCWKYTKAATRTRSISPTKPTQRPPKRSRSEIEDGLEQGSGGRITKRLRSNSKSPSNDVFPTAPSTSDSLELLSSNPNAELTPEAEEDVRIQELSNKSLMAERLRSDPGGTWIKELEWLRRAGEGLVGKEDVVRMWRARGTDIVDDDDDSDEDNDSL
ncbi:hypothetical protein OEA41_007158 [Lepraria neglecta]|uniref:HNH nuclease domain-containing protein n=1 Tax=Lepraria neglecta TaxID=209136 RepID=A0AAD9ZA35_9LECA|nr:hypothetical protein OEA41_007158 [Lepraria neglecta]